MLGGLPGADWDVPRPVAVCRHLFEVASEYGLDSAAILAGTALTVDHLNDTAREVQAGQELAMMRNIVAKCEDPIALAREVGARSNLANTGVLGYALLASPTVGDAVNVACRFATLTSTFLTLRCEVVGSSVTVVFDDCEAPADVRDFVAARDLSSIVKIVPVLIGAGLSIVDNGGTVIVELREGYPQAKAVVSLLAGPIAIRITGRWAMTLPAAVLSRPMPAADPFTAASCVAQCEALLESRRRRRGLSAKVRARLIRDPGQIPAMAQIADELCCTERNLHRRLAAENATYRRLVDEIRETLALTLLQSGLSIAETGRYLGYSETAAFTRAFGRWRGETPSAYRAQRMVTTPRVRKG
jgi:AraC-like DNA-binding protein